MIRFDIKSVMVAGIETMGRKKYILTGMRSGNKQYIEPWINPRIEP